MRGKLIIATKKKIHIRALGPLSSLTDCQYASNMNRIPKHFPKNGNIKSGTAMNHPALAKRPEGEVDAETSSNSRKSCIALIFPCVFSVTISMRLLKIPIHTVHLAVCSPKSDILFYSYF